MHKPQPPSKTAQSVPDGYAIARAKKYLRQLMHDYKCLHAGHVLANYSPHITQAHIDQAIDEMVADGELQNE